MKITYELDKIIKPIELDGNTISTFFNALGINGDDYIVTRDDDVLIEDDQLNEGDLVKLHKVWSGG